MIVSREPESVSRSEAVSRTEAASRTAVTGEVVRRGAGGARVFTGREPKGPAIVSVELVARDTGTASGRARFGADFPRGLAGFPRDSVALSDMLLFAPAPGHSSSAGVEAVAASMLGSTSMRAVRRLGIFWEMYGVRPQDSVDVAIRITQVDQPGFLRRVGQRLGLVGRGGASVLFRWVEPQSAEAGAFAAGSVPDQTRTLGTDISRLGRGHYVIELTIRRPGGGTATSLRAMEIAAP
jgi:hypothetical protein